jgi:protein-S-isoprenylcysteine O-methyltransferase Ste14
MQGLRILDWPPVWLVGFLVLVRGLAWALPWRLFGALGHGLGAGLVGTGLALMGLAAAQMGVARTTVIPRGQPRALVTGGVFRISRNPIYLGDALVLTGAILWWDVAPALLLVPVFMAIIRARFILGEEAGLKARFGPDFAAWSARTRRWL